MYISSLNWYDLMDTPDVDDALARFSSSLNDAFSHYLSPYRKISSSTRRSVSRKYPPWVNRDLVLAIKLKYELYSRYRKFPTPANQSAFNIQRNRVRNLSRSLHRDYLASIQASIASGNLNMYQFVRSQRNRQQDSGLPHLIDEDGHPVSGSFDKATVLNQQFASVVVPDDPSLSLPALRAHSQLHETFVQVITKSCEVYDGDGWQFWSSCSGLLFF